MTKKQKDQNLRNKALKMLDRGMSSGQVAEKLGVRKMTVAAWKAHRTMGTYEQ